MFFKVIITPFQGENENSGSGGGRGRGVGEHQQIEKLDEVTLYREGA